MKFIFGFSLIFIKFALLPSYNLMAWMLIAIALDFVTGFTKATFLGVARTSNGMRRTITKFLQYGGALAVLVVLSQVADEKGAESIKSLLGISMDGLVVFIIYIEVTSIFENLTAIDSESPMARFFFVPMHKLLTAQFKNLPVVKAAEAVEDKTVPNA